MLYGVPRQRGRCAARQGPLRLETNWGQVLTLQSPCAPSVPFNRLTYPMPPNLAIDLS